MSALTSEVAAHRWWHTIEVAPGVLTPGSWDLREVARRIPWPESMAGLRCLDVGTMDGFWAFEMERRGAAEVVAIDVADPARMDLPFELRAERRPRPPGQLRGATFATAARLLGSKASYVDLSVYELPDSGLGEFDLVFLGYVTELLRDPIGGLQAVRAVCRGRVIVLDKVNWPLSLLPIPLTHVAPRPGYLEWFVFNRRGLRRALEVAGFRVEAVSPFLRDRAGPALPEKALRTSLRVRHALGLEGRSLAVRGRVRGKSAES